MINRDFHVHTKYCDGKDNPEDIVLTAISKGYDIIGFSGHATLGNEDWCMTEQDTLRYKQEIARLKDKYRDKIEILCGIEQDYYSKKPEGYDYIIGSVHCLSTEDGLVSLDDTAEILHDAVDKYFGSDPLLLAEKYFETLSDVVNKTGADIVGHADLILKFSDTDPIFDTNHPRYIKASEEAIKKLADTGVLFEVNTGATVRGYRSVPYPEERLLKKIREYGGGVIITGDCHDMRYLGYGFEEALKLIKKCGFKRISYLSEGKIKYCDI